MVARRPVLWRLGLPQRGFALIALLAVLASGVLYFVIGQFDAAATQSKRDEATTRALAQAKEALIAFAVTVELSGSRRPGDLPCPDNWSEGHVFSGTPGSDTPALATPCSTSEKRLGRLPWRTLGIDNLRDQSNERLWYAVSGNFKNNPRTGVLNSDTLGTISIRNAAGNLLHDGSAGTGVVAVIIAPGAPLTRQDGLVQDRSAANYNAAAHYLDIAAAEDNAGFADGTSDGFITGPVRAPADAAIALVNDRMIAITREEIMAAVARRVAAEVANALLVYYCGSSGNIAPDQTCRGAGGERSLPRPALLADPTCLGSGPITSGCLSDAGESEGRIPANPAVDWTVYDPLSPLRGTTGSGNWFQTNRWRELVYVAISGRCLDPAYADCTAPGYPLVHVIPTGDARAVVLVAGTALTGQNRAVPSVIGNYLELDNASDHDGTFRSGDIASSFNDVVSTVR